MAPALALITALATLLFSLIRADIWPVYETSVDVLIQPENPALVGAARVLLNSYQGWLDSNQRALAVIDRLELDSHPDDLMGAVEFQTDEGRLLITIVYTGRNPELGERIVGEWAALLAEWREVENQDTLTEEGRIGAIIVDAPQTELKEPLIWLNTVVGALIGLLVGVAYAFAFERAGADQIRDADDIIRGLSLPLQGLIPAERENTDRGEL